MQGGQDFATCPRDTELLSFDHPRGTPLLLCFQEGSRGEDQEACCTGISKDLLGLTHDGNPLGVALVSFPSARHESRIPAGRATLPTEIRPGETRHLVRAVALARRRHSTRDSLRSGSSLTQEMLSPALSGWVPCKAWRWSRPPRKARRYIEDQPAPPLDP